MNETTWALFRLALKTAPSIFAMGSAYCYVWSLHRTPVNIMMKCVTNKGLLQINIGSSCQIRRHELIVTALQNLLQLANDNDAMITEVWLYASQNLPLYGEIIKAEWQYILP